MKNNNINGKIIAGYLIIGCMSVSALIGCDTKSNVNNSSAENEVITTEQEAEQKTETETETSSDKESLFAFEDEAESGLFGCRGVTPSRPPRGEENNHRI